jgi:hypothetical protein
LSRSFVFSSKNTSILIKTEIKLINKVKHLCLIIEDNGLGDEDWRRKNLSNCKEFKEIEEIIKENGGILKCINNPESGVKYCILFPCEEENLDKSDKIIFFPPSSFKK